MASDSVEIIISIKPQHVENILCGRKKFELRRRPVNVPVGTRAWIYSTLPHARFAAVARVSEIKLGTPTEIKKLLKLACITSEEFEEYYAGADRACALKLDCVSPIPPGADLHRIKNSVDRSFHPPQFFHRVEMESSVTSFLREHLKRAA